MSQLAPAVVVRDVENRRVRSARYGGGPPTRADRGRGIDEPVHAPRRSCLAGAAPGFDRPARCRAAPRSAAMVGARSTLRAMCRSTVPSPPATESGSRGEVDRLSYGQISPPSRCSPHRKPLSLTYTITVRSSRSRRRSSPTIFPTDRSSARSVSSWRRRTSSRSPTRPGVNVRSKRACHGLWRCSPRRTPANGAAAARRCCPVPRRGYRREMRGDRGEVEEEGAVCRADEAESLPGQDGRRVVRGVARSARDGRPRRACIGSSAPPARCPSPPPCPTGGTRWSPSSV